MRKQPSSACQIVAEAGVNHNGSPELAFKLVDVAVEAGADIVKFQTFRAEKLVTRSAQKASYQRRESGEGNQFDMLKALELDDAVFSELMAYCAQCGIGFLSTPFDVGSAKFLATAGMSAFKVSSGDLTNLPFLRELARFGLPIILSTGMATLGEIDESVSALNSAGAPLDTLTLLHCTTEYPAPDTEVNLRAMLTFRQAFPGARVGYSDHTEGIHIPVAAAALGAQVLEKHFTLDRNMKGPDHKASLEPDELKLMVQQIRSVERALGDGRKIPSASEIPNRVITRKSIVAARDIDAGEILSEVNLTTRRPGDGLSPLRWDEVVGKPAPRALRENEPL